MVRSILLSFCRRQAVGGLTFRSPIALDFVVVLCQPWSYLLSRLPG